MRIFTSWSGERSKAAALGLKSLLQDLFEDAVQVFVHDHISPGEAWAQRLGTELERSEYGILCLTQNNFQAPWLLFEAGAIAKKFGTSRIVPYLIDELPPAAERSPLAQFQHVRADRDGTHRLVEAINSIRETPKPVDRLERSFAKWWPDLEQTLDGLQKSRGAQFVDRSDRELLEAILHQVEELSKAHATDLSNAEWIHLRTLRRPSGYHLHAQRNSAEGAAPPSRPGIHQESNADRRFAGDLPAKPILGSHGQRKDYLRALQGDSSTESSSGP